MTDYLSMMFATSLMLCELIMSIGLFITILLRDGNKAISVVFMLMATVAIFLSFHEQQGIMGNHYDWLFPIMV